MRGDIPNALTIDLRLIAAGENRLRSPASHRVDECLAL
jgi:hypothetical protein